MQALGTIEVDGPSVTRMNRTVVYSGLYHVLLHPREFSDVNGDHIRFAFRYGDKTQRIMNVVSSLDSQVTLLPIPE